MDHNHFEDLFVQDLISTVLNHKTVSKYDRKCDRKGRCERTEEEVTKPRAKASAALRYMLRQTLKAAIGEGEKLRAFLRGHWGDWDVLPDVALLSEGGDTSAMCADEKALTPKLTKQLTKVANKFVAVMMGSSLITQHVESQAIVREEMRWVLGNLISIAHGSKMPSELAAIRMVDKDLLYEVLPIGHTKAWYEALMSCDGGELTKEEL